MIVETKVKVEVCSLKLAFKLEGGRAGESSLHPLSRTMCSAKASILTATISKPIKPFFQCFLT